MKKILRILLLIPIVGILVTAQAQMGMQTETDTPDLVKVYVKQDPATYQKSTSKETAIDFAVQVSASSHPVSDADARKEWNALGHVYVQKENGLYKVRIGPFMTQLEAKETLLQAKSKGRADAFIVVLQGTQNDKPLYQAGMDSKVENHLKTEKKTVIITDPAEPTSTNTREYKVQLASYSKPGSFNTQGMEKIGTLESYRKGEMTIMMIGGFKNLPEAQKARKAAMAKGFNDATIVIDNNGILEAVSD